MTTVIRCLSVAAVVVMTGCADSHSDNKEKEENRKGMKISPVSDETGDIIYHFLICSDTVRGPPEPRR